MSVRTLLISPLILVFLLCSCGNGVITAPPAGVEGKAGLNTYLGGGHPIEGINYARNNRSTYYLPKVFEYWDVHHFDEKLDPWVDVELHEMLVDKDERLYLSRFYDGSNQGLNGGEIKRKYMLFSFDFGETPVERYENGYFMTLYAEGIYTINKYYDTGWQRFGDFSSYYETYRSNLCEISQWPQVANEISAEWSYYSWYNSYWDNGEEYNGDWDARSFDCILPLPDGTVLASYAIPDMTFYDPRHLQRLGPGLQEMYEVTTKFDVTGFTLDVETGNIYVLSSSFVAPIGVTYLYCFNINLEPLWDNIDHGQFPKFSTELPVIDDSGDILGIINGRLKRIGSDGSPGGVISCQARKRPALFNDGTIVVICESAILYFDTGLNVTAAIPLPSGPGTGSEYTDPPLIDTNDNFAIFHGSDVWIISRHGDVLAHRTFESDVRKVRLGPDHLFVALDDAIYRFPV